MEQWIEEFLFRGRPPSGPGSEMPQTFHVMVGQQVPNAFDPNEPPQRRVVGPLTPEQALDMGLDLETLIEGINAEAINQISELESAIAPLNEALAAANQRIAELETQLGISQPSPSDED